MTAHFFEATRAYQRENTALFDFITPTAVAVWNLQWQVTGFLEASPDASKEELDGRFIGGADLTGFDLRRANLRRAATERSWEDHLSDFGRVMLYVAVSLYEGWLAEITALFPAPKTTAKQLQLPSAGVGGRTDPGVREALAQMTVGSSTAMTQAFTRQLRKAPKYSAQHLDSLLLCYRYFKECRNVFMHARGVADERLEQASSELSNLGATDLGTRSLPDYVTFVVGDPIRVYPRGVVGLSDVLLRIVTTLDADLSGTTEAERHFLDRWRRAHRARRFMATDTAKRDRQIASRTTRLGPPVPAVTASLDTLLKRARLAV